MAILFGVPAGPACGKTGPSSEAPEPTAESTKTPSEPPAKAAPPEPQQRPNIVVFLVDDMGWQDTSVALHSERTPFNDFYRTPNMQKLAERGVRFSQAYAAAVCTPTRVAIMTGKNPARHRVTNWTLKANEDTSGQTPRLQAPTTWVKKGLQPTQPTLPALLKDAGYTTIHVGKAHWGAIGTPGADPLRLGFDVNIAGHAAGAPGHYHGQRGFGRVEQAFDHGDKGVWAVPGLEHYHGLPIHLTDALTVEALQAVDHAVDQGKPFYLYLAHYTVHTPIQEHAPYAAAYRKRGVNEVEAKYASMVEGMDRSLGAVLSHLSRREVAEQTIVVFASDNGGLSATTRGKTPTGSGLNTHNAPLRAGKGSAYEGGTRIPQIVSWAQPNPDSPLQRTIAVTSGARCDAPTMVEDLFPTILRWTGAAAPTGAEAAEPRDGRDFTPLLGGGKGLDDEAKARATRPLLFHYPHVWHAPLLAHGQGYEPHSAMRLGNWKVIYFYEGKRWELYDLSQDLAERNDLAKARSNKLHELAKRLMHELDTRGALYPVNRHTDQEEPPTAPVVG